MCNTAHYFARTTKEPFSYDLSFESLVARSINTYDRHYSFHASQLTVWCEACAGLVWKLCCLGLVAAGSAEHEAPAAAPPSSCTRKLSSRGDVQQMMSQIVQHGGGVTADILGISHKLFTLLRDDAKCTIFLGVW